ncbi:hypothetical protein C8R46DRAFT_1105337 [Mycena filopes]|nr:hypothetical protein C8R46DRAFT_1105337 [Mycena filopes]
MPEAFEEGRIIALAGPDDPRDGYKACPVKLLASPPFQGIDAHEDGRRKYFFTVYEGEARVFTTARGWRHFHRHHIADVDWTSHKGLRAVSRNAYLWCRTHHAHDTSPEARAAILAMPSIPTQELLSLGTPPPMSTHIAPPIKEEPAPLWLNWQHTPSSGNSHPAQTSSAFNSFALPDAPVFRDTRSSPAAQAPSPAGGFFARSDGHLYRDPHAAQAALESSPHLQMKFVVGLEEATTWLRSLPP